MQKKEILELKKRFTKNGCSFTKMAGCYVDSEKNKLVNFHETFLNLDEEEFYKYLDIAKKCLSGNLHNNLLELEFPRFQEESGGKQQFFMGLRESQLKNQDLIERFFDLVIETYDFPGNYLILIFHDAYDVIKKSTDNLSLDESEEVYEYLLCAICPVTLSKAALGYREDQNRIGSRIRDWVVGAPDSGFLFPAFTDRSADIHSVMFYTKDTKEPHVELMEDLLGCPAKRTATIQKNVFENLIQNVIEEHADVDENTFMNIQSELHELVELHELEEQEDDMVLNTAVLQNVLAESGVPEPIANVIEEAYTSEFSNEPPIVESLVDKKTLEENAKRKEQKAISKQLEVLQNTLEEKNAAIEEKDSIIKQTSMELSIANTPELSQQSIVDVVVKVKPTKLPEITSQIIEGKPCLIIPVEENYNIKINGVDKTIRDLK
ncbi:MAG: DUF4317 domain-containing protein [Lachnospiraceae bacterium]|nr:DUF4317 domain-containing protein [Lachnospiraceae bacterium]